MLVLLANTVCTKQGSVELPGPVFRMAPCGHSAYNKLCMHTFCSLGIVLKCLDESVGEP